MAAVSGTNAAHATLSTTTVDTVTITTTAGALVIMNKSGAADMYVSIDPANPTATPVDPTAAGAGFYCVPQIGNRSIVIGLGGGMSSTARAVVLKVIGNANAYSVQVAGGAAM